MDIAKAEIKLFTEAKKGYLRRQTIVRYAQALGFLPPPVVSIDLTNTDEDEDGKSDAGSATSAISDMPMLAPGYLGTALTGKHPVKSEDAPGDDEDDAADGDDGNDDDSPKGRGGKRCARMRVPEAVTTC